MIYTSEQWERDKSRQALQDYNIPIHAGFLMGEPNSTNEKGELLYLAFGMNDFSKGKKYYYLGLSVKEPELHGDFYFFDCMNACITDRYFKTSAFESEQEAIKTASDYEATLYKYKYKYNHGKRVETNVLYDPWDCFDEEEKTMDKENKLLNYVATLTPEQVDKIINHLPKLEKLIEEKTENSSDTIKRGVNYDKSQS